MKRFFESFSFLKYLIVIILVCFLYTGIVAFPLSDIYALFSLCVAIVFTKNLLETDKFYKRFVRCGRIINYISWCALHGI